MKCKCVPEVERFSQEFAVDAPAGDLILAPRPERTSLLLSAGLLAGGARMVIGESIDNGIVFNITPANPSLVLCRQDVGDMAGLAVWNAGISVLRARGSEEWEKETGRTIRIPDE